MIPAELKKEIETIAAKCYACSKCSSGCPVAEQMDYPPSLMVKWIALDKIDKIVKSKAIWLCSSCQNCSSRCPFQINIPHLIDLLKEYAQKNKLARKERSIRLFHEVFLAQVKQLGRIHELSFISKWKMRSGSLFSDMALGFKMFRKGKLSLKPEKIKKIKEVKKLF